MGDSGFSGGTNPFSSVGSALGAGTGFNLGGIPGAILGSGAGDAIPFLGSNSYANAAQSAAMAQLQAAQQQRAAATAAAKSPQEIAALERGVQVNEQDLQRRTQLLQAVDPSLIAAGNQALQLLNGQDAASLSPVKRQRAEQRTALENNLRSRLGSGFDSSTVGQKALQNFDLQTSDLLTNAQQSAIQQYLGLSQNVSNSASLGSVTDRFGSLAGLYGNSAGRQVSAINSTSLTPYAGAPYVGAAIQGQQNQQMLNSAIGLGSQVGIGAATGAFGSGGGGAPTGSEYTFGGTGSTGYQSAYAPTYSQGSTGYLGGNYNLGY